MIHLSSQIDRLVTEMSRLYKSCQDGLEARSHGDILATTDIAKVTATLVEEAKKLPKMRVSLSTHSQASYLVTSLECYSAHAEGLRSQDM